jgi:hypothetical protein
VSARASVRLRTRMIFQLPSTTGPAAPTSMGMAYSHTMRTKERPIILARGATTALFSAAGLAIGVGFAALGALRRNRPIHSVGTVVPGKLVINTPGAIGATLFDTAGETPLIARLSRSLSWPVDLPDVLGVALRIPRAGPNGGAADLLFASTGTGRITRYILHFHWAEASGPLTTMFPLTGARGNIVFRLDPESRVDYRLAYSRNSGPWIPLGWVSLEAPRESGQRSNNHAGPDDAQLRFRPVGQPLDGLTTPTWLRAARSPAYSLARFTGRTPPGSS